jgi:hypothetical protein
LTARNSKKNMPAEDPDPLSERPPDSDFQQQNLKAWQPLLTPRWVIGTFAVVGILFVPIGVIVLEYSNEVVEVEAKYSCGDAECEAPLPNCSWWLSDPADPILNSREGCSVPVKLTIPEDMPRPIYMYYKLTNFYQNHRRYVKSRSDKQLRGDISGGNIDIDSCQPLEKFNDKQLYPCGLIANSYFNDTFSNATITRGGTTIDFAADWSGNGIAWDSDVEMKFKSLSAAEQTQLGYTSVGPGGQLPAVTDEDFIVWMRTAGLPNFKKLRYRIENTDLKKGDVVTVLVDRTYPVSKFGGEKYIVLSTANALGGKNPFLGWAYIITGTLCLLLALVFWFKHVTSPRPLGDMKYFNWGRQPADQAR